MNNCIVSIVLPTFKRPHSLLSAIESVSCQTYRDFELIVVDDNEYQSEHSNSVKQIVDSFNKKISLKLIRTGGNTGACYARNLGISESRGIYIAFLDDDDIWMQNKLSQQVLNLTHPEIGFTYCYYFCNDNVDGTFKVISPMFGENTMFADLLKKGSGICTSSIMARKSLLDKISGFDTSLESYQDFDLLLRLSLISKCNSVQLPLFNYYVSSDGISKNYYAKYNGLKSILLKYRDYYAVPDMSKYYSKQLVVLGDYAILSSMKYKAILHWFESLRYDCLRYTTYVKIIVSIIGGVRMYKFCTNYYQNAHL